MLPISQLGATSRKFSKPTSIAPRSSTTVAEVASQIGNWGLCTGSWRIFGKRPHGQALSTMVDGRCCTTVLKIFTNLSSSPRSSTWRQVIWKYMLLRTYGHPRPARRLLSGILGMAHPLITFRCPLQQVLQSAPSTPPACSLPTPMASTLTSPTQCFTWMYLPQVLSPTPLRTAHSTTRTSSLRYLYRMLNLWILVCSLTTPTTRRTSQWKPRLALRLGHGWITQLAHWSTLTAMGSGCCLDGGERWAQTLKVIARLGNGLSWLRWRVCGTIRWRNKEERGGWNDEEMM